MLTERLAKVMYSVATCLEHHVHHDSCDDAFKTYRFMWQRLENMNWYNFGSSIPGETWTGTAFNSDLLEIRHRSWLQMMK